jgi:hypothetical protein
MFEGFKNFAAKYKIPQVVVIFFVIAIIANLVIIRFWSVQKNIVVNSIITTYTPQPKPDVTVDSSTGLTTYQNKDGKFKISYPSDLSIHVNEVHVRNTTRYNPVKNVVELDSKALNKAPYVILQFSDSYNAQTVSGYVDNSTECDEIESTTGVKATVSGMPALIYKNVTCSSLGETRVYFLNGHTAYNIIVSGKPVDEAFLAKFLASFEFVQ